jgi:hypothetical protein
MRHQPFRLAQIEALFGDSSAVPPPSILFLQSVRACCQRTRKIEGKVR